MSKGVTRVGGRRPSTRDEGEEKKQDDDYMIS